MIRAVESPRRATVARLRGRVAPKLVVVVLRLLSVAAGLVYVKAYTGALSTAEVGTFFYLATLSYALNALVFVPADFYMQARIVKLDLLPAEGVFRLFASVLLLALVICLVLSAPLVWLGKLNVVDLPAMYAVAALIYLCSSLRNLLNNRGSGLFVSSMLLLESIGRMAAFLAIAALFGSSARILMTSSALALSIELAVILIWVRRCLCFSAIRGSLDSVRTVFRVAAPISGSAVCNTVQIQAYRVAYPLSGFGAEAGLFGVVSNIGTAGMGACSSVFSQLYLPQLYQSAGTSIRRYVLHAFLLSGGVLVIAMVAAPLLVGLLTKEQYLPYSMAIGFGVVTEACNLVIGGYVVLLSIEQRTSLLLKSNIFAALVSMAGCVVGISIAPTNIYLIGFSTAGSQLLMTVLLLALVRKHGNAAPMKKSHRYD